MKKPDFVAWGIGLFTFILVCIMLFGFYSMAHADERPDISCRSGDIAKDAQCMRENWRPKKQVSYDTAKSFCGDGAHPLQGEGYIVVYVDDSIYHIDINCPIGTN